ncbi:hypothetical protein FHG87_001862 [Trinorchestia longiramus]|nr:hypothetical protein FHG87_001862 [Trinorchestia longiramus]
MTTSAGNILVRVPDNVNKKKEKLLSLLLQMSCLYQEESTKKELRSLVQLLTLDPGFDVCGLFNLSRTLIVDGKGSWGRSSAQPRRNFGLTDGHHLSKIRPDSAGDAFRYCWISIFTVQPPG